MTAQTALTLHRRGVSALNAGRFSTAGRLMQEARARTEDPALRARIDASLAYVSADSSDPSLALALCHEALAQLGADHEAERGVLLCQQALIQRRLGNAAEAIVSFDGAVESLASSPRELATALMNRGTVYLDTGELERAASDFERCVALCEAQHNRVSAAKGRHNLGYTRFLEGNLVDALDQMDSAAAVLRTKGSVVRAVGDQDRAEVLLAAGLVTQGAELMTSAARRYGTKRLTQRQAEVELTLAGWLLGFEPGRALTLAQRSARRFRRLGTSAWETRADAVVLAAQAQLRLASPARCVDGDRLGAELEALGQRWAAASTRLTSALICLDNDQLEPARTRLAAATLPRHAPLGVRLLEREIQARAAERAGSPREARSLLRRGLTELQEWQSSLGSLDLQTGAAGRGTSMAVHGLRLATQSRSASVLFEWSERARMLASRVQPVRPPQDDDLVADLTELRELVSSESPTAETVARETELRRRVRERAWRRDGSGHVADPCTLAELQAALDDETALVAYVVTAERVVALVVTAGSTQRVELGPRLELDALLRGLLADLDVAAESLPPGLGELVRGQLVERLSGLADFLVAPLLSRVADREVVLTPSGVLAGVPWLLLPGFGGRRLTVAQSATSWLARSSTPLRTASVGFVAGPRVERAEAEVSAAAAEWASSRSLVGAAATAAAVSELAAEVDVLHVAAHGRHSAENPLFSGVELVDGAWHGYDIDQLRAVPDVVLLSACEVGRSSVRWGEELIGMTAAWLYAGARCVIASSAAVSDEVAHDVLVAFHQQLAAGATPAAALAAAVPAATADRPPAPFVCFG